MSTRPSFQPANLLKIGGKLLKIKFCTPWERPENDTCVGCTVRTV
jgi:hypothetical protein